MTDRELDSLMREILLDAIALDEEDCKDRIPFEPSLKHQRQIGAMLKDPLRWAKDRSKPVWKKVGQRAAVILLVVTISFGSVMAVSPTARAAVLRWITEWYETYVSYRYTQEAPLPETVPEYEITALPKGYEENISKRVEWPNYVQRRYENANGEIILFDYIYMTDDAMTSIETDGAATVAVTVNGHEGLFFCSENSEADSTLSWIDTDQNLHFTINAAMEQDDILHMAESVSLSEMTK